MTSTQTPSIWTFGIMMMRAVCWMRCRDWMKFEEFAVLVDFLSKCVSKRVKDPKMTFWAVLTFRLRWVCGWSKLHASRTNPCSLQDIPSTGLECWFKLEARSQRSTVQGRIKLKLWLSTREDRGTSEEDNFTEVRKMERLQTVFMSHELATHEPTWTWSGELPGPALTILHQMAVQGDLSELQCALARFVRFGSKFGRNWKRFPKISDSSPLQNWIVLHQSIRNSCIVFWSMWTSGGTHRTRNLCIRILNNGWQSLWMALWTNPWIRFVVIATYSRLCIHRLWLDWSFCCGVWVCWVRWKPIGKCVHLTRVSAVRLLEHFERVPCNGHNFFYEKPNACKTQWFILQQL